MRDGLLLSPESSREQRKRELKQRHSAAVKLLPDASTEADRIRLLALVVAPRAQFVAEQRRVEAADGHVNVDLR